MGGWNGHRSPGGWGEFFYSVSCCLSHFNRHSHCDARTKGAVVEKRRNLEGHSSFDNGLKAYFQPSVIPWELSFYYMTMTLPATVHLNEDNQILSPWSLESRLMHWSQPGLVSPRQNNGNLSAEREGKNGEMKDGAIKRPVYPGFSKTALL